ncbi:hypothetical protein [Flavobacterium sp.]|uniref:hypothetical protein n=1 Tax=Flavobacterium sp. TaxID=239 RepID=UPI00374CA53F
MKEEIIEYYFGDIITPLGRPLLLVVGQEYENTLRCEKFIFFEESNGNHIHIGEEITSSKMVQANLNLENFMKIEGLEHAKNIIYREAYAENSALTLSKNKIKKINLRKSNQNAFLLYMKGKSMNQLIWIQRNTQSRKLDEIIGLYKSFQSSKANIYCK